MAERTLSIRKNADETVTIKSVKYVESVDTRDKTPLEKYEMVRWAVITAGFDFTPEIEEIVRKELYA
jgi:hypothetical protein